MTDLHKQIWTERYRPKTWDDFIFNDKNLILKHLENPDTIPSFIFHSNKPGTGKTTLAKLIVNTLGCDSITINASDERGVDVIREKITDFARSLSSTNVKKCVFLDEFDGTTKIAQDCLKSTMEDFSANCFFIFTANDVSKIIEPIQSRCVVVGFEAPNKADIVNRLTHICEVENVEASDDEILDLVNHYYPDIRSMVKTLQSAKIENKKINIGKGEYEEFFKAIKTGNIEYMYNVTYSGVFDLFGFNRWLFTFCFNNLHTHANISGIALCMAEVEKGYTIGANAPIIFLANMVKISNLLNSK